MRKHSPRFSAESRSAGDLRLHELAERSPGRIEIQNLDITIPEQTAVLRARLGDRKLDLIFVNTGVINNPKETIGEVSTEEFVRVMVTNALSPMRVVQALHDVVAEGGLLGVMSSGQGSVSSNTKGMREVYRGSKAALNMYMRSFAARRGVDRHAMALMAPGWVRTEMGGSGAPLAIEDSIPGAVSTLLGLQGKLCLQYLDYLGRTMPW